MTKYQLFTTEFGTQMIRWDDSGVIRIIPVAEDNSDYQRYLRWLENPDAEEGGTL